MSDIERLPPASTEAEQALLGCILIDNDCLLDVLPDTDKPILTAVTPDAFHDAYHRIVWEAMLRLDTRKQPIDLVTLPDEIKKDGRLPEDDRTESFVIGLMNAVPTSMNAPHYAKIILDKSIRRKMIAGSGTVASMAFDEEAHSDTAALIAQASDLFMEMNGTDNGRSRHIKDVALEYMKFIDERQDEPEGAIVGLTTGLVDLDRLLKGIKEENFVIIAGRPGMGKTALVKGIELHNAVKMGKRVMSFSLEMSSQENLMRYLASEARIPTDRLSNGSIKSVDQPRLFEALGNLSMTNIVIDDSAGLTIPEMRHKCRIEKARNGLDLVTVDYIQLMQAVGRHGTREQQVSELSRGLKLLAKELKVVVIATAQLSRAVEQRQEKRPMQSDLRDSGSLEQDPDIIMFLYRDEYYNPDTSERPNIAEINVAKHRNGPTGTVDAYWHGKLATFRNLSSRTINLGEPIQATQTAGKYR